MLPPGDLEQVGSDELGMQDRSYRATSAAAYELHGRNTNERERLRVAQQYLLLGTALTLVFGGIYTLSREAPKVPQACCCAKPFEHTDRANEQPSQVKTTEDLQRKIDEVRKQVNEAASPRGPLRFIRITTTT
jgi:hypothetical protein